MPKSFSEYCKRYMYETIANRVKEYVEGRGGELQRSGRVANLPVIGIPGGKTFALRRRCRFLELGCGG